MEEVHPTPEKQDVSVKEPVCCSQCGWPGTGEMPAGVRLRIQDGKTVLVGKLSYFRTNTALCSLCQEMKSAVATRPWFVKAQADYLDQIKAKKQILGIK